MQLKPKVFAGSKVRRLRERQGWTLETSAGRLGLSASYLSQIETGQRPISERVLAGLIAVYGVEAEALHAGDDNRLAADLREATLDAGLGQAAAPLSEIRLAAAQTPALSKQFLALHRAYRRLEERVGLLDEALSLDEAAAASALLPYEEVRDYFHYKDNYIDSLDAAAEALAGRLASIGGESQVAGLERELARRHQVRVTRTFDPSSPVLSRLDVEAGAVILDGGQPSSTQAFQLASQLVGLEFNDLIEVELNQARFRSAAARDVARVGLINYAAGALLLPYGRFHTAAKAMRHDLERLQLHFGASCEQICHRLSNLQRPGAKGTPFYFVRVDMAGNITKRHSATPLQFARFGGACPLWNVHDSFGRPGEIIVQLAATPDETRYLCLAVSVVKRAGAYNQPVRKYALGLGCEVRHAADVVYSDGLDLGGGADPIGISCRLCERRDCRQRAFPALNGSIVVPRNVREIVPYQLKDGSL